MKAKRYKLCFRTERRRFFTLVKEQEAKMQEMAFEKLGKKQTC